MREIRSTVGRLDFIPHYKRTGTLEDVKHGVDMINFRKILMAGLRNGWKVLEAGRSIRILGS